MAPDWLEVLIRLAQYAAALPLFGVPLFRLYNRESVSEPDTRLLMLAALWLAAWTAAAAVSFAANLYGAWNEALLPENLWVALAEFNAGRGLLVRTGLALVFAAAARALPAGLPRMRTLTLAGMGALITASFAWTGHGVSTPGAIGLVHLVADVVHLLAAAAWLGALAALLAAVFNRGMAKPERRAAAHRRLARFSGLGTLAVILILASGLVNAAFLVGLEDAGELFTDVYGRWLMVKVVLFAAMLALAGLNRFVLTPRLASALTYENGSTAAIVALRASIVLETVLGMLVLLAVAAMGRIAPIAS